MLLIDQHYWELIEEAPATDKVSNAVDGVYISSSFYQQTVKNVPRSIFISYDWLLKDVLDLAESTIARSKQKLSFFDALPYKSINDD